MMGGTHDGQALCLSSQVRQVLADSSARDGRGDRLKDAAIFGRRIRFHIEGVDMAHATPGKQDDARFRSAEVLARVRIVFPGSVDGVLQAQDGRERQAQGAQAQAEHLASGMKGTEHIANLNRQVFQGRRIGNIRRDKSIVSYRELGVKR